MTNIILSRHDAASRGMRRFFTGRHCARGHLAERFTTNGACVDCQNVKLPRKNKGPQGNNVAWPVHGLVCNISPVPPKNVLEAAFRAIEAWGWYDQAVRVLLDDPAQLLQFEPLVSDVEIGLREAELSRLKAQGRSGV